MVRRTHIKYFYYCFVLNLKHPPMTGVLKGLIQSLISEGGGNLKMGKWEVFSHQAVGPRRG